MIGKLFHKINHEEFFLGIILFTLPFPNSFNSKAIVVSLIFFVYKIIKNRSLSNLKFYAFSFLFFISQLISFSLSSNFSEAIKKLILFLPFLILPLFFVGIKKEKIDVYRLFNYLNYGVLTIILYGWIRFLFDILYLEERYDYGRTIALLSKYIPHHVYLSIFILIGIYATVKGFVSKSLKAYNLWFLPFLYVMIFVLGSRTAMVIAIFVLPLLIFNTLKGNFKIKNIITILSFSFLILMIIGFSNEFSRDKIIFTYYDLANIATKRKPFDGISDRKMIWKSTVDAIKDSPYIGYGLGDAQYALNTKYSTNGYYSVMGMNTHNQYLQFLLTYGFIITALLLIVIISLVYKCVYNKDYFLTYLWLVLLTFCLTESILNRHWGVLLFAYILNLSIYKLNEASMLKILSPKGMINSEQSR